MTFSDRLRCSSRATNRESRISDSPLKTVLIDAGLENNSCPRHSLCFSLEENTCTSDPVRRYPYNEGVYFWLALRKKENVFVR